MFVEALLFLYQILGTVTVNELAIHRRRYFRGDGEKFLSELRVMLSDHKLLDERKKQIDMCSDLKLYMKGAKTIVDLQEKFNISGDFSMMEKLIASVFLRYIPSRIILQVLFSEWR